MLTSTSPRCPPVPARWNAVRPAARRPRETRPSADRTAAAGEPRPPSPGMAMDAELAPRWRAHSPHDVRERPAEAEERRIICARGPAVRRLDLPGLRTTDPDARVDDASRRSKRPSERRRSRHRHAPTRSGDSLAPPSTLRERADRQHQTAELPLPARRYPVLQFNAASLLTSLVLPAACWSTRGCRPIARYIAITPMLLQEASRTPAT